MISAPPISPPADRAHRLCRSITALWRSRSSGKGRSWWSTLVAFTAAVIVRIVPLLPKVPRSWIVAGGGARNLTMLRRLRERLAPATVETADALGWSADAIEAQAFGFLAARGL